MAISDSAVAVSNGGASRLCKIQVNDRFMTLLYDNLATLLDIVSW